MKILYFGSVVSDEFADYITKNSKVKPSVAAVNFQRNLLKGMHAEDMEIHSLPPIPMFPNSKFFAWGARKMQVLDKIFCSFVPALNLPVLKQISVYVSTTCTILLWALKNRKEKQKMILQYGQYAYFTIPVTWLGRLLNIKTCEIVTDPVAYSTKYANQNKLKQLVTRTDWAITELSMKKFDGYVFLTKYLVEEYSAENKPHIILEGIADMQIFDGIPEQEKAGSPAIMYAGALTKGFGIPELVEAVHQMNADCRLWLFGDGDCVDMIKEAAEVDSRIQYFGKVPRAELLTHMKKATLLVSTKPIAADHTKYQFPSKIMEYMASRTVVAATTVPGIPEEYFKYIYPIRDDSVEGIRSVLEEVLAEEQDKLMQKGNVAFEWLKDNKTYDIQGKRISGLLLTMLDEET